MTLFLIKVLGRDYCTEKESYIFSKFVIELLIPYISKTLTYCLYSCFNFFEFKSQSITQTLKIDVKILNNLPKNIPFPSLVSSLSLLVWTDKHITLEMFQIYHR